MSKIYDLNKRAAKFGLAIVGSDARADRYALFSATTLRRTPDVTIEIIEEWLDDLESLEIEHMPLSLFEYVDADAANAERERRFSELKAFINMKEAQAKKPASDE